MVWVSLSAIRRTESGVRRLHSNLCRNYLRTYYIPLKFEISVAGRPRAKPGWEMTHFLIFREFFNFSLTLFPIGAKAPLLPQITFELF